MIKVGLYSAEFFARHGYYKEEQILGNRFLVTIEATFNPQHPAINDDLEKTLNYEALCEVAHENMKYPQKLLETVAQGMADAIMQQFPYINHLQVEVKKLNPPLKGQVAASGVTVYVDNN
ncbi:dihydroneopterin aldolase [Mucilaginibacter terrae]|uniref:7,8-dihydroneopterin aldolase n=1 Tax=Mucilaginibacter terrae TaxID=1955052 RepID=A0ABU3GMV7_9SPHI|nr:dihydroneopterin aldolase [Mucilaginibacter terrae]MDT3400930.1 dihydroneopterin aldolase [Mucilaginibacter terrae]